MKMKKLGFGIWPVWVCGIFFIFVSFYHTGIWDFLHMKDQLKKPTILFGSMFSDSLDPTPTVTVFTAPRGFVGSVGKRQQLAVVRWKTGGNIDFSFLGTPFFHSLIARAQASSSDISFLIDPEIILFPDFSYTLQYAAKLDQDWLPIASSPNSSLLSFPSDAKKLSNENVQKTLRDIQKSDRRMLLAWNNGDVPLHNGVIPPFLYGKGIHNHWVIAEALSSDYRFVFDASWIVSSSYVSDLNHSEEGASSNSEIEKRNWEFTGNVQLGKLYGSFSFRVANFTNLFRFCKYGGNYPFFVNTEQNIVYPLGDDHKPFSLRNQGVSGPKRGQKILECVDAVNLDEGIETCFIKNQLEYLSNSLSLPYSLEDLLSLRADQNMTVVLAVAGYSYKDMLMSWVCRLNQLNISNFLVSAIDPEIYEFSVLQGLPVYAYKDAPTNISFDSCHFGTECFQKVTKVKSRMVLQILKKG